MSPAGWCFLALVGVLFPYAAIRSGRRLDAGMPMPPRAALFVQTLLVQAFLLGLALATAWRERIALFPARLPGPRDVALGLLALAIILGSAPARWRHRSEARKRRLYAMMPRDGREMAAFALVCLAAGIGEEIVYRGVLWTLLARLTGTVVASALLCTLAFSLAHMVQGAKSVATIFALTLGFHALVYATGSLYVAMAVHVVYDLGAGVLFGLRARREMEGQAAPIGG